MKKVFADTNIMLDYLEDRRFTENSKLIFKMAKDGKFQMYASLLSFVNIAYIRRKHTVDEIYNNLLALRQLFVVLPIDSAQLDAALTQRAKDFEDSIQFQCAQAAGCDVIVTNNVNDFKELQGVEVMSSEDFLLDFFAEETIDNE